MRLIQQAMLLRHYPYGAKRRELVAIITALWPDAWRRLTGRMPAQHDLEQALQQHEALATQIDPAPESSEQAPARNTLERSYSITATATRSRPPVAPVLPTRINSYFEANPYRPSQLSQPLLVRTQGEPNLIVVGDGFERAPPINHDVLQCSSLGPYWAQHIQPILGADGKNLPVYQLRPDQFELCKGLVAPSYFPTGAMMQYFGNGRIDIAITLQRQDPLDRGIIAATSSDRAATWDKVILRDEKGAPVHLLHSKTWLETGLSFADQPQKETLKPMEMPSYSPNGASCNVDPTAVGTNVNAIPIQALPAAVTPRQATETAVFNDCNTTTESEDHRATPGTSSARPLRAPDGLPPHDEAAPTATQTFEAEGSRDGGASSQDTPLDELVRARSHAREVTDKDVAGEEPTEGTPTSPEPEHATYDTPTPPEPQLASHDTPTSPEPDRGEGSKKRKERSPSPPASGHKRSTHYRSSNDNNSDDDSDKVSEEGSEEDSSDDDHGKGNGGGPRGRADRLPAHSPGDAHGSPLDVDQTQTEMTLRPRVTPNTAAPAAALAEDDASCAALTETMRDWRLNTQSSSPHVPPTSLSGSAVQQRTPPTLNGENEQSRRGEKRKFAGTRELVEDYNDSDDDEDEDGGDEDEDEDEDEGKDDGNGSDDDGDDESGDDGNQGAEIQGGDTQDGDTQADTDEHVGNQGVESQAADNQSIMDQDAEEHVVEEQDAVEQDAVEQDAVDQHTPPDRGQDESDARPETTQPEVSEDEDGDFEPDDTDSGYDASDSESDSEGNASDFSFSNNEVRGIIRDVPSAPINGDDDESEDESDSALEYSGDEEGEFELGGRRDDSDSGGADDEFESDDESDDASNSASPGENDEPSTDNRPNKNNVAEESESDVVSSDDSDSESVYSSGSEWGIGSDDTDEILGYKF
jgi:hypothetical protein